VKWLRGGMRMRATVKAGAVPGLPMVMRTFGGITTLVVAVNIVGVIVVGLLQVALNSDATPHQRTVVCGEACDVVALFVDITGSTKLTHESDPREFIAILNRFFRIVVSAVEHNGGLVNKFEGDAALCVFGAPVVLDDPTTAALRAARAIRDEVYANGELDLGIGVASGPVIAGQIGAASRLEYTVIGDAMNEAARLTDLAKRVDGRILASGATVEAAAPA
jgi:class 3 adenylate cyclase